MSIQQTIKQIGTLLVGIAVLVVVLTQAFGIVTDAASATGEQPGVVTTQGASGQLALSSGRTVAGYREFTTSLGTAVQLRDGETVTGASADLDTQASQWTVCTYATPADRADNVTATVLKYDEAAIIYNGTSDTYRGYFFDLGNRSDVDVEVGDGGTAAPKLVCLSRDNATIRLSRNTSAASTVQLNTDPTAAVPPNTGFNGTIDETRVYDRNLTSANKSAILAEPTQAIAGPAPALRLTYDARTTGQQSFRAFFAGTEADVGGAAIVDSFAGESLTIGTDIRVGGVQNATITVLDGGAAKATGEIIYTTFAVNIFGGIINAAIRVGGAALSLLVLGALVLAAREVGDVFGGGF